MDVAYQSHKKLQILVLSTLEFITIPSKIVNVWRRLTLFQAQGDAFWVLKPHYMLAPRTPNPQRPQILYAGVQICKFHSPPFKHPFIPQNLNLVQHETLLQRSSLLRHNDASCFITRGIHYSRDQQLKSTSDSAPVNKSYMENPVVLLPPRQQPPISI